MPTPSEEHADFQMEREQVADIADFDELNREQLVEVGVVDEDVPEEIAAVPTRAGVETMAIPPRHKNVVEQAVSQHGYREEPGNQPNCNMFSRYFGKGCQQWCADFVSWAYDMASDHPDKKVPWGNPSLVVAIAIWARNTDNFVPSSKIRPGDIFLIHNGNASHVGLVRSLAPGGGKFASIEGNTSKAPKDKKKPEDYLDIWVWSKVQEIKRYKFVRVP